MEKQRKPLSTMKPPVPSTDHNIIMDWLYNETMPNMQSIFKKVDELIIQEIPNLYYSIKWNKAFYGTPELGWLIEVGVFAKSMNIVFLNGAKFERQPPMGTDAQTRYMKISSLDEINNPIVIEFIKQAASIDGWK